MQQPAQAPCPGFFPTLLTPRCARSTQVSKVVHRAKCLIVAPDVKPNATAHIHPVKALVQVRARWGGVGWGGPREGWLGAGRPDSA